MHTNKVLHRDLKTQNVFMLGNGRLVLGDLGISKVSQCLLLLPFTILKFLVFMSRKHIEVYGITYLLSQYENLLAFCAYQI